MGEVFFTSISAPPADHHRTPTFALSNLVYVGKLCYFSCKTPRFWYTLKTGSVGGEDPAFAHPLQDSGP